MRARPTPGIKRFRVLYQVEWISQGPGAVGQGSTGCSQERPPRWADLPERSQDGQGWGRLLPAPPACIGPECTGQRLLPDVPAALLPSGI